jgi:hypothetical protein
MSTVRWRKCAPYDISSRKLGYCGVLFCVHGLSLVGDILGKSTIIGRYSEIKLSNVLAYQKSHNY